jgi:hypothetical protein
MFKEHLIVTFSKANLNFSLLEAVYVKVIQIYVNVNINKMFAQAEALMDMKLEISRNKSNPKRKLSEDLVKNLSQ